LSDFSVSPFTLNFSCYFRTFYSYLKYAQL
jgi:hypothetical protein